MSSAVEIAAAVRDRSRSAVEVTEEALARAESRGPRLGAFVMVTPELALAQALAVDEAVARGEGDSLALAGVPCPIKDLNQVAGVPMSAGSRVLAATPIVPTVDDGVVTRLREAGTTMVGKTATPEFGFPPYTEPRLGPDGAVVAARTPWDLSRGAGGSSGGAAAAVAAGIVPIAHASDGGGSIRIPAASCGIVGFKPSRGLVSPGPWGVEGNGLSTGGVLARTVRDSALALDAIAGPWPGDTTVPPSDWRSRGTLAGAGLAGGAGATGGAGVGGGAAASNHAAGGGLLAACGASFTRPLRVGLLTVPVVASDAVVHPEAEAAAQRAARTLEGLGHEVTPAPVPFTDEEWEPFMALWSSLALMLPVPDEAEEFLTPLTRWLRSIGRGVSGAAYAQAMAGSQQIARQVARVWSEFDVILTPSLAAPPAPVGSIRNDEDPARDFADQKRFTPWTSIANLTGAPSVSLPVHRATVDGIELPFGAMLTGWWGRDAELFALSAAIEEADPWPAPPTGA